MKKLIKYIPIFLVSVILTNCAKDEVYEVITEPRTELDVAYGSDVAQKMDIYLPAGRSQGATKVLVLIHGGGWMAGDKTNMASFVPKFQTHLKDYAVVNLNYRLATFTPRYMLPTQTDDIRSAMDYIEDRTEEFGVSDEFVLLGLSAGGHLAMLYSYKYDTDRRVQAVVNIVGPSNLNDDYYNNNSLFSFAMNYIIAPENLPSGTTHNVFASPVTWISSRSQPTISFYGSADDLIPQSQHTALEEKLNQFNVPNEKYIYTGGHEVGFKQADDIVAKTKVFLAKHVR